MASPVPVIGQQGRLPNRTPPAAPAVAAPHQAPAPSLALLKTSPILAAAFSCSIKRKPRRLRRSAVAWQDLVRQADAPEKHRSYCASWGCGCAGGRETYPYASEEEYFRSHPAAKVLAAWCHDLKLEPTMWAAEPGGYRTRGKLAVGAQKTGVIIGLFKRGTWKVLPVAGCVVNHPRIMMAVERVRQVLNDLQLRVFDHDGSVRETSNDGAIRYVEMTLERHSGLMQLVIVWNGSGEEASPQLEALLQKLWPRDASSHSFWHSIWVHWRDPDPSLLRAIHSKRQDAWQQVRPHAAERPGHVLERLDGLDFAFGPASFQQVNLQVFEKILQDMKRALMNLLGDMRGTRGHLRILELCSGVGVIGLSLAHAASRSQDLKHVTLLSTDINPNCATLFQENSMRTFPEEQDNCDVKFSACTAAEALATLGADGADVLVLDPPRRGLADKRLRQRLVGGEDQAAAICNSGVQAVIYMSCGHDSFMADAERLMCGTVKGAFDLKSLSCYDMFPYTPHLETLGIFLRRDVDAPREPVQRTATVQVQADQGPKLQCQFIIGIKQDRDFNVKQRLLGERGHHVKLIAQQADCKLRLRGKGSGFKEGPLRRESQDPLMLCISSKNENKHQEAVELVRGLVEDVYQQYRSFKEFRSQEVPNLQVRINEGPRPGSRTSR